MTQAVDRKQEVYLEWPNRDHSGISVINFIYRCSCNIMNRSGGLPPLPLPSLSSTPTRQLCHSRFPPQVSNVSHDYQWRLSRIRSLLNSFEMRPAVIVNHDTGVQGVCSWMVWRCVMKFSNTIQTVWKCELGVRRPCSCRMFFNSGWPSPRHDKGDVSCVVNAKLVPLFLTFAHCIIRRPL